MKTYYIFCNGDGNGDIKRWFNGGTINGGLSLTNIPYTNGTEELSGTLWAVEPVNNPHNVNAKKIICKGFKGGNNKRKYLNCDVNNNKVDLVANFDATDRSLLWVLEELNFEGSIKEYRIRCLNESHGTKYLNGGTGNGGVDIVEDTNPSGTNWVILESYNE